MKMSLRYCLLLAAVVCAGANRAQAAVATWSEEMTALPGANWGAWDDVGGLMKNDITVVSGDYWRVPAGAPSRNFQDYGMAIIDPMTGNPAPPTAGLSQYSAELRYRNNTPNPYPNASGGNNQAFPVFFNVGSSGGAQVAFADGFVTLGVGNTNGYANLQTRVNEGTSGSPTFNFPTTAQPARGDWHTVRISVDETTDSIEVYHDGALISSHTADGIGFTRSMMLQQIAQFGPPDNWVFNEVDYDYIRVVNRIVPIGEAITAVPEPVAGLIALVLGGLGAARRRRS